MVQLMPLLTHHLYFRKIQNDVSFWYWPTQVVLEKRLLNECCCCCWWWWLIDCYKILSDVVMNYSLVLEVCLSRLFGVLQHTYGSI